MLNNQLRQNNFDLIRLLAASQVLLWHGLEHLKLVNNIPNFFITLLSFFPGVPIFFTVSGFLIYQAYIRSSSLKQYFINRFLRIYPGLFVCFLFTFSLILIYRVISIENSFSIEMILWVIGQLSIFQFYTPDILRSWGVGTPNGSLWTIPVEIQFYFLLPALFYLMKKTNTLAIIILGVIISIIVNAGMNILDTDLLASKLLRVNVIPYLYNFLFGVVICHYWEWLSKFFINKAHYWLMLYASFAGIFSVMLGLYTVSYSVNIFMLINTVLVSCLTLSFAFSYRISNKIPDISYGVYIYHMPVFNAIVASGLSTRFGWLLIGALLIYTLSFLSYKFVERPALNLKNKL